MRSLLLILLVPSMLEAQGDRWQRQIDTSLARAEQLALNRGFAAAGPRVSGSLNTDESEWRGLALKATTEYLLVGVCDADCHSLGLVLSNPNGDEMVVDRQDGNAPLLQVQTRMNGEYRVRVIMGQCRISPCRYGVAVFRKR